MARKNADVWRRSNIEQTKIAIKKELDHILLASGKEGHLFYIVEQMQQLEKAEESQDMLRRFVLVVSALVHHCRFGGLGKRQITELSQQGFAILKIVGIKPGHSLVSFLYSELHAILSDIHHANSEFVQALWERQLAAQMAIMPPEHEIRQNLGMGTYAFRLGHSSLAINFLQQAFQGSGENELSDRIRVQLVKCLRVSGQMSEATDLIRESHTKVSDPACQLELDWQLLCIKASLSNDLSEMLVATRKGKSHYQSSYPLEAYLWAAGHPKTQWLERVPSLDRLPKLLKDESSHLSDLFSVIQPIAEAYDTQVPFAKRLMNLKRILPKITQLHFVDHELLVWNAIARWLYRNRNYELAAISFYEYKSLCQKLSEGQSSDLLLLAEDLTQVNWIEKNAS